MTHGIGQKEGTGRIGRFSRRLLVVGISGALVGSLLVVALTSPSTSAGPPTPRTPIHHVVEIMMENHAFDNLFGTFPGVLGFPAHVRLPNGSGGEVAPYWIDGDSTPDLPHDRGSQLADLDQGRMDGFVEEMARYNASAADSPMGYYNATQVAGYWALAHQFRLCDMYFASVLGPTNPNRLYAIAGSSGGITTDSWPAGGVTLSTIFDQLSAVGISWRYYYAPDGGAPIPLHLAPLRNVPAEVASIVPLSTLLPDLRAGELPAVTVIDPSGSANLSEHPPENVTVGEAWSLSVIAAIEASPEWNSTAVFLTWDEGGGYYDSVVPPPRDAIGDGFRVPMLVVSPFSRGGNVDSTVFDHTSVLKFIDQNWGLSFLTPRVAATNSLGQAFSFPSGPAPTGSVQADRPGGPFLPGSGAIGREPMSIPRALASASGPPGEREPTGPRRARTLGRALGPVPRAPLGPNRSLLRPPSGPSIDRAMARSCGPWSDRCGTDARGWPVGPSVRRS